MTRYNVSLVISGNNDCKEHVSGDVVADGLDAAMDLVSAWINRSGTICFDVHIESKTSVIFTRTTK
jgi:hypothetical protein